MRKLDLSFRARLVLRARNAESNCSFDLSCYPCSHNPPWERVETCSTWSGNLFRFYERDLRPEGIDMPEEQIAAQLMEEIRGEQRRSWLAGERVRAETFLQRYPALQADPDRALEVVYGEVMLREEHGEAAHLDEYLQRFPMLAAQLGPLFEVHQA